MNELEKWVLQEMVKHLEDLEGQVVYGCDLAFKLFKVVLISLGNG